MNSKRILFITWDNPMVTYMEGLFVPIFARLSSQYGYEVHIIQFSWMSESRVEELALLCRKSGISYFHHMILLKPHAAIGKYITLSRGAAFISDYVKKFSIDIAIARSTMPGKMTLKLPKGNTRIKVIFDADGLPIEERVDFAGLEINSWRYKQLKKIEKQIITRADAVLVRTFAAREVLLSQYDVPPNKFFKVINGRDPEFFKKDLSARLSVRKKLGIPANALILTYSGSIGPQYGIEQMLYIYREIAARRPSVYLLVITNNPKYFQEYTEEGDKNIIIMSVPFEEVPQYLATTDVAFAIRKDSFSMKGVSPVKLAEYILMQIPVIASSRIGDSEVLLAGQKFVFLLESYEEKFLDKAVSWIEDISQSKETTSGLRTFGIENYGLAVSARTYHEAIQSVV